MNDFIAHCRLANFLNDLFNFAAKLPYRSPLLALISFFFQFFPFSLTHLVRLRYVEVSPLGPLSGQLVFLRSSHFWLTYMTDVL